MRAKVKGKKKKVLEGISKALNLPSPLHRFSVEEFYFLILRCLLTLSRVSFLLFVFISLASKKNILS